MFFSHLISNDNLNLEREKKHRGGEEERWGGNERRKRKRERETVAFQSIKYLGKAMAPHSSTLAWKIPWTEEPGRLQSTGSLRVRHD